MGPALCVYLLMLAHVCCADEYFDASDSNGFPGFSDIDTRLLDELRSISAQITSLDQRFDVLAGKIRSVEESFHERLTVLGERLALLDERGGDGHDTGQMAPTQVLEDLQSVCVHLSQLPNVTTPATLIDVTSPATNVPTVEPGTPFTVSRVTKTETDEAYLVKVEYLSSVTPTGVFLRKDAHAPLTAVEGTQPRGEVKVELAKNFESTHPHLIFVMPDRVLTLALSLVTNHTVFVVPDVTLKFLQGNNVTFVTGDDVTLNFTYELDGDPLAVSHEALTLTLLTRSEEEEAVVTRYPAERLQSPGQVRLYLWYEQHQVGHRQGTLLLTSGGADLQGILETRVSLTFDCSQNCLVKRLTLQLPLTFYREDHQGPFPPHFLGFVHGHRDPFPTTVFCALNRRYCFLTCTAVGAGPADVTISRLLPSGDLMTLNNVKTTLAYGGSSEAVLDGVTSEDAGVYPCVARGATGEVIREDLTVQLLMAPLFELELSNATLYKNGSLTATCVARGQPAPNVTFSDLSYYLDEDDYNVTLSALDEGRTRADLVVPDPAKARSVPAVQCVASNTGEAGPYYSQFDAYHYMIPQPEL